MHRPVTPEEEARFLELDDRLSAWNQPGVTGPSPTQQMGVSKEEFIRFRLWQQRRLHEKFLSGK